MQANPERQEVKLVAEVKGEQKTYVLKYTSNAACALEDRVGKTTRQVLLGVGSQSVKSTRDLVHAMLQEFHADEFPDTPDGLKAAGRLIDQCGGLGKVIKAIAEGVGARDEQDKAVAEAGPNPQEAQAGTGGDSTLKLVASA